jgi:pyruvate ferredoxin oxidoreductase alpha subunit
VRKSPSDISLEGYTVIAGLGCRAIARESLERLFEDVAQVELGQVTLLDLNVELISGELERDQPAV